MNKERFNVVFYGQLLPGYEKKSVILQFSNKFKISQQLASNWFSGKKKTIKKSLSYQDALRYKTAFARLGAKCELHIVTDEISFKNALIKPYQVKNSLLLASNKEHAVEEPPHTVSQQDTDHRRIERQNKNDQEHLSIFKFDSHFCFPKIYRTKMETDIENEDQESVYTIISDKKKFGYYSVIIITVLAALVLQNLIIKLVLSTASSNLMGSVIGIIGFFSILYFTPKLLWPKQTHQILSNHGSDEFASLAQINNYRYLKQVYTFESKNKTPFTIQYSRSRKRIRCLNKAGVQLFSAERDNNLDDLMLQAGSEHAKQLLNLDLFNEAKIPIKIGKRRMFFIRDFRQNVVAVVFPGKVSKLIVNHQVAENEMTAMFIAIAMIFSGI